jgi:sporulation protein YlmC with PRC-barrel domain
VTVFRSIAVLLEVSFMTVKTIVDGDGADKVPTLRKLRDTDQTISRSDEDIRGRAVKDKDGRAIGKIEGLLVDDVEQKVRFIEVASGGFFGFGETKSFIPVEAITHISEREVSIGHTAEHVAGAPRYNPHLVATDTHFFFNLYPYYGYEGYLGFYRLGAGYPYPMADHDRRNEADGPVAAPIAEPDADSPAKGGGG